MNNISSLDKAIPVSIKNLIDLEKFEFESSELNLDDFDEKAGWEDNEDLAKYLNPCKTTFGDMKKEMSEILRGIWKKIVKPAEENSPLVDLNRYRVSIRYNMYQEGDEEPFDSNFLTGKECVIDILNYAKQAPLEGFIEALNTMQVGEQSLFIITYKKMFKEMGCEPRIRPKSDIFCDIIVDSIAEMGDETKLENMRTDEFSNFADVKESFEDSRIWANDRFKQGKLEDAMRKYKEMLSRINWTKTANEDERQEKIQIVLKCYLNLAICYLTINPCQPKKALEQLEIYEGIDENAHQNSKFLYNKGNAYLMDGEYEKAKLHLEKALKIQPNSGSIALALTKLKNQEEEYIKKSRETAKKMFQ